MPKEGAVNNKKKLKYCAESNQWISFTNWKKHKTALAQIEEARRNQDMVGSEAGQVDWRTERLREQNRQINDLTFKLKKANDQSEQLRQSAVAMAKAYVAAYDEH